MPPEPTFDDTPCGFLCKGSSNEEQNRSLACLGAFVNRSAIAIHTFVVDTTSESIRGALKKMHIVQTVIQFATLVSVIIGFWSLISTVRNYRRQLNLQILMKYTERYEHILSQFPENALFARFDSNALPPQSQELTLCVLKYLNLCSEEFYLWRHKYLANQIWQVWEGDLKRMIASALLKREWLQLREEFLSHKEFLDFVEAVHADSLSRG